MSSFIGKKVMQLYRGGAKLVFNELLIQNQTKLVNNRIVLKIGNIYFYYLLSLLGVNVKPLILEK